MNARMYEKTVTTNGQPSKWNVNPVLMYKSSQVQSCLTYYYHFIYQNIPTSHIKAITNMHNLLTIPSNQYLFSVGIKYRY